MFLKDSLVSWQSSNLPVTDHDRVTQGVGEGEGIRDGDAFLFAQCVPLLLAILTKHTEALW